MMALTPIKLGSAPNDGMGDNLRTAGQKINDNFAAIEATLGTIPTGVEGAGARSFTNVDALLANTQITYSSGSNQVVAGNIVRTLAEGFAYRVAASGASDHHVTTAGRVKLYVLPGPNGWNVKAFGAKGNNTTDDTAAFNAAIRANSAWAGNQWAQRYSLGRGTIHVPRGNYLINGTISTAGNTFGVIIKGEGPRTTRILKRSPDGVLFQVSTYEWFELRDMELLHDDPRENNSNWTAICVSINGNGGGQNFKMDRVRTRNWNRVINHEIGLNEDTSHYDHCYFQDCNTFLYARNTQALVNKFNMCSWFGHITRCFDIIGYNHTHIDSGTVIQRGSFLYFANGNNNEGGPGNQYLLTNTKFEFEKNTGTTKIIDMAPGTNTGSRNYIKMVNCGIAGGSPDPDVFQFDLQGGVYTLHVDGGNFASCRIRTRATALNDRTNQHWVKFENCVGVPSTSITRVNNGADGQQPDVTFQDCHNIQNITLTGWPYNTNSRIGWGLGRVNFNKASQRTGVVGSGTRVFLFPTYGQLVHVRRITLLIGSAEGWNGGTMKVFLDAARTVQLGGTITLTNAAPAAYEVTIPVNTLTSEGVFVETTRVSAGSAHGYITCETVSI